MGNTTRFSGAFTAVTMESNGHEREPRDLNDMEGAYINSIINGQDDVNLANGFTYIDLDIKKKSGTWQLKHNGAEKTHGLDKQIEYVLRTAIKQIPGLTFSGEIEVRDEYDDHYKLVMDGGKVVTKRPKIVWD